MERNYIIIFIIIIAIIAIIILIIIVVVAAAAVVVVVAKNKNNIKLQVNQQKLHCTHKRCTLMTAKIMLLVLSSTVSLLSR